MAAPIPTSASACATSAPSRSRQRAFACAALVAALACTPAGADDTEIFFGQISSRTKAKPNVLFLLDTSGSMSELDGGTETRLTRMKNALYEIVDKTGDVNVGVMRFQGSGGGSSVIFPMTPIDDSICDYEPETCEDVDVTSRVAHVDDDSEERASTGEHRAAGFILSMNPDQLIGLRFGDLRIPQGATISSARLEFTSHYDASRAAELEITAHDQDDAERFSATTGSIGQRPEGTSVDWDPGRWKKGGRVTSADISAAVQAVVNRPGWCGGNALSLEIANKATSGGGREHAPWSYEHAIKEAPGKEPQPSAAPTLRVTYDKTSIPASGGCRVETTTLQPERSEDDAKQVEREGQYKGYVSTASEDLQLSRWFDYYELTVGLHFRNSGVPKNAEILSARLEFEISAANETPGPVSLNVDVEQHTSAATFDGRYFGVQSGSTPLSGSPVVWNDVPESGGTGEKLRSPELGSLVQGLVDQPGWNPGLGMNFKLWRNAGTGTRTVHSYDGKKAAAPKLLLRYRIPSGTLQAANATSVREAVKRTVFEIDAAGGTPIVDALYEASQYYRGGPVGYGRTRGNGAFEYQGYTYDQRSTFNRVSHPRSYTGGSSDASEACRAEGPNSEACREETIRGSPVYTSPITASCQTNHLVLLTDGEATSNTSAARVRTLTGATSCEGADDEECGVELAAWLNGTDHASRYPEAQNVMLHTIAFNLERTPTAQRAKEFNAELATVGGGGAYEAEETNQLVAAFDSIIGAVQSVDTSFVAPGATVNQFNRLTHRNDIYFALYKPESEPRWSGNLKRYRVGRKGDGIAILDANGSDAVDEATGFFARDASSFWSAGQIDGGDVMVGGAAYRLGRRGSSDRRLYTFVGDDSAVNDGAQVDLTDDANAFSESNPVITAAHLGLGGDASAGDRRALIEWARGVDVHDEDGDGDFGDSRAHMGDPMHSRPVILNYSTDRTVTTTADDGARTTEPLVHTTVYVATNEGFLHAIDNKRGDELYGFIPEELMRNLALQAENDIDEKHRYGFDGTLSAWTDDVDNDVMVDPGESAYLYIGMRRGGSSYYAFDVSERERPKLAWAVHGGLNGTPGFEELGQSWSRPVPTRIMVDARPRDVLVFGAGYAETQDPDYDVAMSERERVTDDRGRGFFIVDAKSGELIHSVLPGSPLADDAAFTRRASLTHAVPGDIRVIDVDFDGLADQMWFGDMGGQIWRWDLAYHHQSGRLLDGGVVARLGGSDYAENRRFYYEPDVSLVGTAGKRFLSIAIGSGWRAHPLNTVVRDRFYVLRSDAVYGKPTVYGKPLLAGAGQTPITDSDLVDVTNDLSPAMPEDAYGWRMDLEMTGEKVLGDSITVNNQVIFTSYVPEAELDACSTAIGGGRVYTMNIFDGSPATDPEPGRELGKEDRWEALAHGGIPPEPAALITEDGPVVLVGPEQFDRDFDNLTRRSYWRDNGRRRPAAALAHEDPATAGLDE